MYEGRTPTVPPPGKENGYSSSGLLGA